MTILPLYIAPSRFDDADAALNQVRRIYDSSIAHLRDTLHRFVAGEDVGDHVRACYPFVRVHTSTVARADSRLAYGFVARVLSGPTLSPLGQFVTRVLTPALPFEPKTVPGPPKRFAQAIGATLSVAAVISYYAFGNTTVALVLVAMITVAASLESFLGYCLGCTIFGLLMKAGVIPPDVCEACNDLSLRQPSAA